jgi:hypothetical protein
MPLLTLAGLKFRSAAVSRRVGVCYPSDREHWRHGTVKRRELITLLGGATVWPLAARAQQRPTPVVGLLSTVSPEGFTERLRAFRQGLKESGYVEGENVTIEYRWTENQPDRCQRWRGTWFAGK